MRYLIVLVLPLATAACVSIVPPDAGKFFSVEHPAPQFAKAARIAQEHCDKFGLRARHLGTDTPRLSRFECVAR